MKTGLTFEEIEYIDDKSGRVIVRITPVFIPNCTASGKITFAIWEYWKDTENREAAINAAMNNAKEVMKSWYTD